MMSWTDLLDSESQATKNHSVSGLAKGNPQSSVPVAAWRSEMAFRCIFTAIAAHRFVQLQ